MHIALFLFAAIGALGVLVELARRYVVPVVRDIRTLIRSLRTASAVGEQLGALARRVIEVILDVVERLEANEAAVAEHTKQIEEHSAELARIPTQFRRVK
jgi:hypothetical protein